MLTSKGAVDVADTTDRLALEEPTKVLPLAKYEAMVAEINRSRAKEALMRRLLDDRPVSLGESVVGGE